MGHELDSSDADGIGCFGPPASGGGHLAEPVSKDFPSDRWGDGGKVVRFNQEGSSVIGLSEHDTRVPTPTGSNISRLEPEGGDE